MLRTSATTEAQSLTAFYGQLNKGLQNSYKNDKYLHIDFGFFDFYSLQGPLLQEAFKEGKGGKMHSRREIDLI